MRASLGLLCLLTLVVVGSALHRMNLYQETYGFTTLRLTVDVFEGWLGVVVLLVMVVGGLGYGRWLPRIALVTGAVAVLGLASINPDAWVAGRNIDRFEAKGEIDLSYLQSLSRDAAPVIADRLPEDVAACVLFTLREDEGWRGGQRAARMEPGPVPRRGRAVPTSMPATPRSTSAPRARRCSRSTPPRRRARVGDVSSSQRFLRPGPCLCPGARRSA